MMRSLILVAAAFGISSLALAQSADDLSGIELKPQTVKPLEVEVDLGVPPVRANDNLVKLPTDWDRFAGGVWAGFVGQGVFGTFPRFSNDEAFKDASEKGLGVGLQLDVGVSHSRSQALRFRAGYLNLNLRPDAKTLESFSASELEGKLRLFHFSTLYRWAWRQYPGAGVLWFGAGVSMNYVAKTESADRAVAAESRMHNTFGFGYQVAAGLDYPLFEYTDLGLELMHHPFRSFSVLASMRTSL